MCQIAMILTNRAQSNTIRIYIWRMLKISRADLHIFHVRIGPAETKWRIFVVNRTLYLHTRPIQAHGHTENKCYAFPDNLTGFKRIEMISNEMEKRTSFESAQFE